MAESPLEPILLRPAEAATLLAISRSQMYELLASGEIPAVRIRRSVRVSVQALHRWVEQQERAASEGVRLAEIQRRPRRRA